MSTEKKNVVSNPDSTPKDVDQDKAKAFAKSMIRFFEARKTRLKIKYLVAVLLSKYVSCTVRQEVCRFCVEYIKSFPKTVDESIAQTSMKDAVNACNKIKEAIDLNQFTFNKIIISNE